MILLKRINHVAIYNLGCDKVLCFSFVRDMGGRNKIPNIMTKYIDSSIPVNLNNKPVIS